MCGRERGADTLSATLSHSLGRTVSWSNNLKKHFVLWFFPEKSERFIWFFVFLFAILLGAS